MFKKIEQQAANKAAQAHAPKKAKEEVKEPQEEYKAV